MSAGDGVLQHGALASEGGGGSQLLGAGSHCPGQALTSCVGRARELLLPAKGLPLAAHVYTFIQRCK